MKSKRTKHILLGCAVILVVACICLGIIAVTGAGVSLIFPSGKTGGVTLAPTIEAVQDATPTTESNLQEETQLPEESDLPEELREAMSQIETQVIQIRGLEAVKPVERALITSEELREIVTTEFFSDYTDEDSREDVLILSALGLLPKSFNLRDFYHELYSEQIAGFYDSETKEMYVVQGIGFGGYEKITYAHEYTHVLQDQVYGLDEGLGMNEESCTADSERCAAVQALIEGDATLTELLWFRSYATEQDYDDYNKAFEDYESPVLDSAPAYMAADLYFPYEYGYIFVQLLYNDNGYDAVDAAYENVPVSTEQILHPERYPDDTPVHVALPDLTEVLGGDWSLYDQNVMGEWYTFLILNKAYDEIHRLSEAIAQEAAEGWGGDAYAFYLNESTDDVTFVMDSVWDTTEDADEFADAFMDYADLRWEDASSLVAGYSTWVGDNGTVVFLQEGARTLWVLAPDAETAESILTELQ